MPVPERVLSRSVGLEPDGYPYETPKEGQGDTHKTASQRLEHALDLHLSRWRQAGTYKLSGDLGLHRRAGGGDPYQAPAPDIIVYLQAPDMQGRQSFRLEEDGPPDLVLEILSERTWTRDIGDKRTLYESMGIDEYWLYDPGDRRLRGAARVQGFRLVGARYAEITPESAPVRLNGARQPVPLWRSAVLQTAWGLDAQAELRLLDPRTETWYPTLEEYDRQFAARGRQIEAQDRQIEEQGQQLSAQDQQLKELKAALARYQKPREP